MNSLQRRDILNPHLRRQCERIDHLSDFIGIGVSKLYEKARHNVFISHVYEEASFPRVQTLQGKRQVGIIIFPELYRRGFDAVLQSIEAAHGGERLRSTYYFLEEKGEELFHVIHEVNRHFAHLLTRFEKMFHRRMKTSLDDRLRDMSLRTIRRRRMRVRRPAPRAPPTLIVEEDDSDYDDNDHLYEVVRSSELSYIHPNGDVESFDVDAIENIDLVNSFSLARHVLQSLPDDWTVEVEDGDMEDVPILATTEQYNRCVRLITSPDSTACPICMENIQPVKDNDDNDDALGTMIVETRCCSKMFHDKCLRHSVCSVGPARCPMCRWDIKSNEPSTPSDDLNVEEVS
ncbi:MAG: hypothetical protein K0U52_04685 [Gammaproteobacteria bacterium]|nr:hypothetical protein [Gammaproteobacteria bacterium]